MGSNGTIDDKRALAHLMDLLAIEGQSGREGKVAAAVKKRAVAAGCKPAWIGFDRVHEKIPGDFETGNLIIKLPGTVKAPRRLLMGHMDTVPLCRMLCALQMMIVHARDFDLPGKVLPGRNVACVGNHARTNDGDLVGHRILLGPYRVICSTRNKVIISRFL